MKFSLVKYALLPGIIPRLRGAFENSFFLTAYSIACIFYGLRIFPASHPYVNPDNIGRFAVRHVLAQAAQHIEFKWKNIDQIVVYLMIVCGVLLVGLQFGLFVFGVISHQPAIAQELGQQAASTAGGLAYWFARTDAEHYQDFVMIALDRVFGVPQIFNSCVSVAEQACLNLHGQQTMSVQGDFPFPVHAALHQMLNFYSKGVFIIAIFVIMYFVVVIVGETSVSGSPFGKRYNKTWIPLRIILFFALLMPISFHGVTGLNAGQFLTLGVARVGSDFASNGWKMFHETLARQTFLDHTRLLNAPVMPSFHKMFQSLVLAKACGEMMEMSLRKQGQGDAARIVPFVVREVMPFTDEAFLKELESQKQDNRLPEAVPMHDISYAQALAYNRSAPVRIVFGPQITEDTHLYFKKSKLYPGKVFPACGEIMFHDFQAQANNSKLQPMQGMYYDAIKILWDDPLLIKIANCKAAHMHPSYNASYQQEYGCLGGFPYNMYRVQLHERLLFYNTEFGKLHKDAIKKLQENSDMFDIPKVMKSRGWASSALFYQHIAQLNGGVTDAALHLPRFTQYPYVMEWVAGHRKRHQANFSELKDVYNPTNIESTEFSLASFEKELAVHLYEFYDQLKINRVSEKEHLESGNVIEVLVRKILGAHGMYDMLRTADVNPMAQLSALGKGIMEVAIRNLAIGKLGDASLKFKIFQGKNSKQFSGAIAGFAQSLGYLALTMGFSLYYVMPLMPFVYFFFAFGGWIKSIFEAVIGVPLWAMAHITRWDGDGIAGPAAQGGYMLLLEIMLRPILILFGLVASISFFSASVVILNDMFQTVIVLVSGANPAGDSGAVSAGVGEHAAVYNIVQGGAGQIDEFFYTIVYVFVCYSLGLACFKMIDQVPNKMLRWMSFTTKTFQESNKNSAQELSGMAYKGVTISTGKLGKMTGLSESQKHAILS